MKVILFISLLLLSQASRFEVIDATPLGKTLFDTIAVELATHEPLDHLFDMLYDLEDRYIADQKEDDLTNKNFQNSCDNDLEVLSQDIANAEQKIVDLQSKLDDLIPERNQKISQRTAKINEKKELQKVMDDTTAQRTQESDDFDEKMSEYQYVSQVLFEARMLFTENFSAPPSFLQVPEKINSSPQILAQVTSHFSENSKKVMKMFHVVSFGRAIKLLSQLTSRIQQENTELVGRIIKLIDDLQNQLNQSFDLERKSEDERINAYKNYMGLLQKDMNKYNSDLANLETTISSLNDQIESVTNSQNDVKTRLDSKLTQQKDRKGECLEAAYDYQQRRLARDNDRQTVSDLLGIINTNMRELKEYISLRLQAGDNLE